MVSTQETKYGELVQPDRVHRRVYADPQVFDEEMRRVFGRAWVYVGHESEVAQPGDYKTTYIGKQPVIVTRNQEDGQVYVLFNRCAHRGTIVCRDEHGNANRFRCPYHGWTYRNNGALLGVPYRDAYAENFELSALELARVAHVDNYRGFIFARLSAEGVGLDEYLGGWKRCIDDVYDKSPSGEIIVAPVAHRYFYRGNWKFQIENVVDLYHPPFSHESNMEERTRMNVGAENNRYAAQSDQDTSANSDVQSETHGFFPHGHSYFGERAGARGRQQGRSGPLFEEWVEALAKRVGRERAEAALTGAMMGNKACYPNLVIQGHTHVRVPRPISIDLTEVRVQPIILVGAPEEVQRQTLQFLNLTHAAAAMQQTDDVEMFARAQEGLQTESGLEWLILARGMDREVDGEVPGERVASGTDETPFRAQFHAWKELMRDE